MKKIWIVSILLCTITFGCVTTDVNTQKSQLQIREFQTRTYDTNDSKMVMKAMLNVLQDDGYIVKNAVVDMGLLSAEKSVDIQNKGEAFMIQLFGGQNAVYKKASIIECSANVSEYGKECRVRVNFQVKIMDNKGGIMKIEQINDEKYYQDFFAKCDKGIFIQKEKI
jgi:hypothetical protein